MKVKDNIWKTSTSAIHQGGVYKSGDPYVKRNGVWVKEPNIELPTEVFSIAYDGTSTGSQTCYYVGLQSDSPMYLRTYNAAGQELTSHQFLHGTLSNAQLVVPVSAATRFFKMVCDGPVWVIPNNGTHPFWMQPNARVKEILYFHPDKFRLNSYLALQSTQLNKVPDHLPASVTNLNYAFQECRGFNHAAVSQWDTKNVLKMDAAFQNATVFNQDISNWNVTNVTSWSNFRNASALSTANTPPKFR